MIIVPSKNRKGLSDMTGAFRPEADALSALTGQPVVTFDPGRNTFTRMTMVDELIRDQGTTFAGKALYFLCHGTRRGLQTGHNISVLKRWKDTAEVIKAAGFNRVVLFACSTGGGKDNLAQLLSEQTGLPVYAHTNKGHTTKNPYAKLFTNGVGEYMVKPNTPEFYRWQLLLQSDQDFRLSAPLKSKEEIARALESIEVKIGNKTVSPTIDTEEQTAQDWV